MHISGHNKYMSFYNSCFTVFLPHAILYCIPSMTDANICTQLLLDPILLSQYNFILICKFIKSIYLELIKYSVGKCWVQWRQIKQNKDIGQYAEKMHNANISIKGLGWMYYLTNRVQQSKWNKGYDWKERKLVMIQNLCHLYFSLGKYFTFV